MLPTSWRIAPIWVVPARASACAWALRRRLGTQAFVEKPAVELIEPTRPHGEGVVDERQVDVALHQPIQGAVFSAGRTDMHLSAERGGGRLRGNDADRAAHRLRTVEGALRAAQHLDARHVNDVRIERLEHRYIVDVEAGGIRTLDPAQRDAAGRE